MKTSIIELNSQYTVYVRKNNSIVVVREGHAPNAFKIGDMAEYNSYNLSYYGEIVSITEKTVTIKDKYFDRKYRLKLDTFAWRNYNFSLENTIQENAVTSMYI
jgi:hypothetical protein